MHKEEHYNNKTYIAAAIPLTIHIDDCLVCAVNKFVIIILGSLLFLSFFDLECFAFYYEA